jgi:DNA-binding GntR family transcriptional regulator
VAASVAASLSVATAATVVTAGPSSPLYGTRLWIEELTLPGAAGDRSDAHRQRLEARLAEAQAAAASGDGSAVAQALAAYQAEVAAALEDVGDDEAQLLKLEAALATHLIVLDALIERAPPQAADAITHARTASDQAVDKIKEKKDRARPTNEPRGPREDR